MPVKGLRGNWGAWVVGTAVEISVVVCAGWELEGSSGVLLQAPRVKRPKKIRRTSKADKNLGSEKKVFEDMRKSSLKLWVSFSKLYFAAGLKSIFHILYAG